MFFTLPQLAGLPGLPTSDRALRELAASWVSRPRTGRGGGVEYSIESLPTATRQALQLRELLNSFPFQLQDSYHPGEARTKLECKLWVLQALEQFCRAHDLPLTTGRELFVKAFNHRLFQIPAAVVETVGKTAIGTLKRWMTLYRRNFEDLQPKYKGRVSIIDRCEIIKAEILSHLKLSASQIYRELRHLFPTWEAQGRIKDLTAADLPRPRTIAHWLQVWKRNNPREWAYNTMTRTEYNRKYRRAVGRGDEKALWNNHYWEMDATKTDIILADGKRYTVIGVIDIFSRRCKFHVADTNNAENIVRGLLFKTILDWGVPDTVITDQGKDFCSVHMGAALHRVGAEQHICNPASGWEKPHIERVFRTLNSEVMASLPGYIGNSIANRPDRVSPEITPERLQEIIDNWVFKHYHRRPHGARRLNGKSPMDRWNSCTHPVKRLDNPQVLKYLLATLPSNHGMRKVGNEGVKVDGYHYAPVATCDEFWSKHGQMVEVRYDPINDTVSKVFIYDRWGKFICEATCEDLTGDTRTRIEKVKNTKKVKRVTRHVQKGLTYLTDNDVDLEPVIFNLQDSIPAEGYHIDQAYNTVERVIDIQPIASHVEIIPDVSPIPESIDDKYLRYRKEFHLGTRQEDLETIDYLTRYEADSNHWHRVREADAEFVIPPCCRQRPFGYLDGLAADGRIQALRRWHHPSQGWRAIERRLHRGETLDLSSIYQLIQDEGGITQGTLDTLARCQSAAPYAPDLLWAGCDAWEAKKIKQGV